MLDNEVIGLSAVQRLFEIIEPLVREIPVDRIHYGDLIVLNDVRVVSHTVRHDVLPLKQVDLVVIDAYVNNVIRYLHNNLLYLKVSMFPYTKTLTISRTVNNRIIGQFFIYPRDTPGRSCAVQTNARRNPLPCWSRNLSCHFGNS